MLVSASQKQDLRFAFPIASRDALGPQTRSSQDDNSVGLGSCFPTFAANCAARMGHPCSGQIQFHGKIGGEWAALMMNALETNVGEEF